MKKRVFALAAAACMAFGFAACDGDLNLTGSMDLVVASVDGDQPYAVGDSIKFQSALSNVKMDTIVLSDSTLGVDTTIYNLDAGTLMVGAMDNIATADFESLTFPLCGINLRGDETKTYNISSPVDDINFFKYLNDSDINSIIASGLQVGDELGNLFALAVSEEAFYIGYEGSIKITHFGNDGSTVDGTIQNVKAIYVTVKQLEELAKSDGSIDLTGYFPTATFNGTISSRRLPLDAILNALEENK